MARKKKGELPSGSIRRQVFIGYEYLFDKNGNPIVDENGHQKKKRKYASITADSVPVSSAEVASSRTSISGLS